MGFKASIIGGAGGMGQWFAGHLSNLGVEVCISDIDSCRAKEIAQRYGYQFSESNIHAVNNADFVLVAVPMRFMKSVIDEIAEHIDRGAIICEIASFKMQHFSILKRLNKAGLTTLSLHPMFGPSAVKVEDLTFAVIPVESQEGEVELANSLFPGADIVAVDVETHDRVMSNVLSLTYLMNLAFSLTVNENEVNILKKLAGTSFTLQMGLAESITLENIDLVNTILHNNHFSEETIERYLNNIEKLKDQSKFINTFSELNNRFRENLDKKSIDNWRYESYLSYRAMKP